MYTPQQLHDCLNNLPVSAYGIDNTYPQALAGNPGNNLGFGPLLYASVYRFTSSLGPNATLCCMSPPEKHIKRENISPKL